MKSFWRQLGDGLRRLGRHEEADAAYRRGADKGIFLSFWQRSLYNVDGLRAAPVWTKEETGQADALTALENNWKAIRQEALAIIDKQKKKVRESWSECSSYIFTTPFPG
jgi:aspartate beta-hydroxylase